MKKIAVLSGVFALIGSFAAEAQTTQKGVVKEFNSGGSPVAGVQIAAMGAAATDSDGDGRFVLEFSSDATNKEIEEVVLKHKNSQKWIEGKTPKKIIIVPKKIVNVVV